MGTALNKSSLNRLRKDLRTYERFLPTLELKQQQLRAEVAAARELLEETDRALREARASAAQVGPFLTVPDIDLRGLVTVEELGLETRNAMGTPVPVFRSVRLAITPYSLLARPHWVDALAEALVACAEAELRRQVAAEAHARLTHALTKVTQRVNLFEKVLIPETRASIARIRVFLADAERMAVVRSKIAKRKLAAS